MVSKFFERPSIAVSAILVLLAMAVFWFTDWPEGVTGPMSVRSKALFTAGAGVTYAVLIYVFTRGRSDS